MRRKPKTSKDLVAHFQKRCIERLGIILNQRVLKMLLTDNKLMHMRKQSNTRTLFKLPKEQYNGKTMLHKDVVLVYDKLRHNFVTVMPFDSWLQNHDSNGYNLD